MNPASTQPIIQPYLFFGGRCEEALEFYRTAIGAELQMLMRHKDSPDSPPPGRLAEGGQVQMPLMKTFWSPCFGMVTDRFGLDWMITVAS